MSDQKNEQIYTFMDLKKGDIVHAEGFVLKFKYVAKSMAKLVRDAATTVRLRDNKKLRKVGDHYEVIEEAK